MLGTVLYFFIGKSVTHTLVGSLTYDTLHLMLTRRGIIALSNNVELSIMELPRALSLSGSACFPL